MLLAGQSLTELPEFFLQFCDSFQELDLAVLPHHAPLPGPEPPEIYWVSVAETQQQFPVRSTATARGHAQCRFRYAELFGHIYVILCVLVLLYKVHRLAESFGKFVH